MVMCFKRVIIKHLCSERSCSHQPQASSENPQKRLMVIKRLLADTSGAEKHHWVERVRCGSAHESNLLNLTRKFFLTNYRHGRFVRE